MYNQPDNLNFCVIVPTYNNIGTVAKVITDIYKYCTHIIVVDDGSNDGTSDVLANLDIPVNVVSHKVNKGKGAALVTGFKEAKMQGYTHAITIDADGQHFADDIPAFIDKCSECSNGIIVGCRNLNEENMPKQNTFANRFSNFWFHLQTGINLNDTQSGFRLYPLSILNSFKFITSRYESELELLVFSAWQGVEISSIPIKVYYPPEEKRVSHFHPFFDFCRISILNTVLTLGALVYYWPHRMIGMVKDII